MTSVRITDLGIGCKAYRPRNNEELEMSTRLVNKCPNNAKRLCRCYVVLKRLPSKSR